MDWATGGGVYVDYLEMCAVVENMKTSGEPTPALVEQLRPRLLALCAQLNNLRGTTATHRYIYFLSHTSFISCLILVIYTLCNFI